MKRDEYIVEFVLKAIESLPLGDEVTDSQIHQQLKEKGVLGDRLNDQVKAAMYMLREAGFIEARVRTDGPGIKDATAWRLTWAGADLLSPYKK